MPNLDEFLNVKRLTLNSHDLVKLNKTLVEPLLEMFSKYSSEVKGEALYGASLVLYKKLSHLRH